MPALLKYDVGDSLAIKHARRLREMAAETNYNILINPWVWAPDPLIHSIRWLECERRYGRPLKFTRWITL